MIELLNVTSLTVAYGRAQPAVEGVNFSVLPGEAVALVGPSGSGKSSCAAALLGLLPKKSSTVTGEARFQRKNDGVVELLGAGPLDMQAIRGREIGMIFQDPSAALNPVLSCGHQLREAVRQLKPPSKDEDAYIVELLDQVELSVLRCRLMTAMPGQLSGGQLQRLMLAIALAGQPRLLIADEPTTALDSITELEIVRLLDTFRRERNMGLLFITHDENLIRRVTDRSVTLPGAGGRSGVRQLGADAGAMPVHNKELPPVSLIEVSNLSIRFADAEMGDPAITDCGFRLMQGEWIGLIGPSGCGKSTIAKWLSGLSPAAGGTLRCGDFTFPATAPSTTIRKAVRAQMIFQDVLASLNPRMTVRQCIREATPDQDVGRTEDLLQAVGLTPERHGRLKPHQLSGGERQRLAIARALAAEPRILICDEALSGLDVLLRSEVVGVLQRVCAEKAITVILITHDLHLARSATDRLLLMEAGRIVERGSVEKILTSPESDLGRKLVATLELRQQ
ncbi:peptide/nickel transport system ATP-binding protein [Neolewinella xylanilytica]|uniref:Peptide/nickel transport system ATP-binding protein n=1 Tax=Neolewinella xylanilytica TaxID=1514080 RepID=A0A2S6I6F3_9BACT|nr:ATP-binding cassette domain-containing protein [Neolewinella xylanilytica]PPK86715.1 peptide/nickel transport system ATP-binding protein [Neolewinella xylanilytica]